MLLVVVVVVVQNANLQELLDKPFAFNYIFLKDIPGVCSITHIILLGMLGLNYPSVNLCLLFEQKNLKQFLCGNDLGFSERLQVFVYARTRFCVSQQHMT